MGLIIGNLLDTPSNKALSNVTVSLKKAGSASALRSTVTDKNGGFEIDKIPFGVYSLQFTTIGYAPFSIDSIRIRSDRFDFNLGDIKLSQKASEMAEVVVYAEKPLLQTKDGIITFNVGESALSAGSSTNELLKTMPLVSSDANGKILLKGKEPKILIDDKPTDLTTQQLSDLLESLPGSSIEKIELMTNPPPQYATETGGVINIVTRKGKVGLTGRISVSYGTRGETSLYSNISYRNKKFSINVNGGVGGSRLKGDGNSSRTNFYPDSSNQFNTSNKFLNKSIRPNLRVSADYEFSKQHTLNFTAEASANYFENQSVTEYTNINKDSVPYKISYRSNHQEGDNINPSLSFVYNYKGKDTREQLQVIGNYSSGLTTNQKDFFQQFLTGDKVPTGVDSTQKQNIDNRNRSYSIRANYRKPIKWANSILSFGASANQNHYTNLLNTYFLRKSDSVFLSNPLLSNDFDFAQTVLTVRIGISIDLTHRWKFITGIQQEFTKFEFDFHNTGIKSNNEYQNLLPNFTLRKDWETDYNLAFVYRKTVRRPGSDELNPSVNYNDPYNLRFGNPTLLPQLADNFDFNFGKSKGKFYVNASVGYNYVQDIIQQIRTLKADGKTTTTYQNITDRREYELSLFGGYSFSRALRINASAGYTYNQYGAYDREVNKYINGGSFYSNINYNIIVNDRISFDGALRFNSIADPQGRSRSNLGQNLGMQVKFLEKRLTFNFSMIDIFSQQRYTTTTTGTDFTLQSTNNSNTGNMRFALSYNLKKNKSRISNKERNQLIEKFGK
jgi:hypothetical protein